MRTRSGKRRKIQKEKKKDLTHEEEQKKAISELRSDILTRFRAGRRNGKFYFFVASDTSDGYSKVKVTDEDSVTSEELHAKIFNKKNFQNNLFERSWRFLMGKIPAVSLKGIIHQFFPILGRDGEEKPKNKGNIIKWIKYVVFEMETNTAKRAFEKKYLLEKQKSQDDRFFQFFGKDIPIEIIKIVISFMPKNMKLLNGLGLINEKYYLLCLSSWESIFVHSKNIRKIPLIVLESVKEVSIQQRGQMYVTDVRYLLESLKKVKKIECYSQKLFSAISKKPALQLKIDELIIGNNGDKYLEEKYFPNLKKLSLFDLPETIPILGNIESLEIRELTDSITSAKKLRELKVSLHFDFYNYSISLREHDAKLQSLKNLKFLTKLYVFVGNLESFQLHICCLSNLEELKIKYFHKFEREINPVHFNRCKELKKLREFHFKFCDIEGKKCILKSLILLQ